jgi:hypothetical protein
MHPGPRLKEIRTNLPWLRVELEIRVEQAGHCFEWAHIKPELKARQEVTVENGGKSLALQTQFSCSCGRVFQLIEVAIPPGDGHRHPPTIREIL